MYKNGSGSTIMNNGQFLILTFIRSGFLISNRILIRSPLKVIDLIRSPLKANDLIRISLKVNGLIRIPLKVNDFIRMSLKVNVLIRIPNKIIRNPQY